MAAKRPHFWRDEETALMLNLMNELNILKYLDVRKMFQKVSDKLTDAGFPRTVEQVRCRWKALKSLYYKTKKHNNTSGSDPQKCPFYNELDQLLGHRPLSSIDDNAVDLAFEEADADNTTPANTCKLACWLIYFSCVLSLKLFVINVYNIAHHNAFVMLLVRYYFAEFTLSSFTRFLICNRFHNTADTSDLSEETGTPATSTDEVSQTESQHCC